MEMLEALYDFKGTIPQTLSFSRDDIFIFHSGNNMEKNWWSVINIKGKMGYIPSNYVAPIKVSREKLLDFLGHSLEHLGRDISRESGGTDKQLELMQELITRRQELMERKPKVKSHHKEKISSSKSLPNPSVDDQVRKQTGLSYESARIAVRVVTEGLSELVGSDGTMLEGVVGWLESACLAWTPPPHILDSTPDAQQLTSAFSYLTACRADAQQRSWQLWDDEHTISQKIALLTSILNDAHPAICQRVLKISDYADVSMLVEYYQMENRLSIRSLLVQTFAVMCKLDKTVISILLNSVLPMELAREMQSNIKKIVLLEQPAQLLSMIFSMGEPMPITHLEHLGGDFVKLMFELIESERENDIADMVLILLLSYNLQFKPHSTTNITIQALCELDSAKTFTEKVMLLINREDDPVAHLKTHHCPFHSVLKLLKDIFTNSVTAKLFYTNDVRVLIDIILRQLTDLSPNHERRTDYLELCRSVMLSCDLAAFEHRADKLRDRFIYILEEETPPVEADRAIVVEIMKALPQLFGRSLEQPTHF
ncbi:hypothetical protein AAG570_010784 [Ranatra chinensis]|uniref:SH3 domain-containing protein n=1 Tax=Ranatra chinensis TaxID=642074 RepID=A0ABD0Z1K7_9HEMI